MSQPPYYPPPQQTQYPGYPQYGAPANPYADPLGPAKRASIVMFILGALLLLCGLCFTGVGMVPMDQWPPESIQRFQEIEQKLQGVSVKALLITMGMAGVIPGFLFIILGFFVRGGGMGAVISAIVLDAGMILLILISLVFGVIGMASGRGEGDATGLCLILLPTILMGILLVFLIQAARAAPSVAAARQQYAAQYYHYQQQQQAYQQQQQGYPPPPPSQQPPPPAPPTQSI